VIKNDCTDCPQTPLMLKKNKRNKPSNFLIIGQISVIFTSVQNKRS
jgi:hypothetical protein